MVQSLDLGNTDFINIDGLPVERLQLNGNDIWVASALTLIAERSSNGSAIIDGVTYPSDQNMIVSLVVSAGDGGATATYDGVQREIPANSTVDCIWGMYKGIDDGTAQSGEIIIKGNVTQVKPWSCPTTANSGGVYNPCIIGVSSWSSGEQFVSTKEMFVSQNNLNGIINVPNGIIELGEKMFYQSPSNLGKVISINLPNTLLHIGVDCFSSSLFTLDDNRNRVLPTIPASVSRIDEGALNAGRLSEESFVLRFLHPLGAYIDLSPAGDGSGIAYSKSSRPFIIYTDNETIKNYDWGEDNVVATFYHLDGTAWE